MVKDTKLYDVLELNHNATEAEIEKQYKLLARKWHPDKNKDKFEEATRKTQELNEAKEILLNSEKRKLYDQFGLDMANGNANAGPSQEDLFNMFGGRREADKENIVIQQEVSLEQIYNEHTVKVDFKQKYCCEKCGGVTNKCELCDGKGIRIQVIQMGPMIQQMQSTCHNCRGSGKISKPNSCSDCRGEGYKLRDVSVNVPLKNGLLSGQQIHLQNMGHQFKDQKTDLIVVIQEKDHPIFKRDGNNLLVDIELKLFQALFGFDKLLTQLDGRILYLSHTGITDNGTKRKIQNEGMIDLRTKKKGDLILNFTFKLPIITKPDIIQILQYNLKSIDQEESNNELEIRVNNSKYNKTILTDIKENESHTTHNRHTRQHGGRQQFTAGHRFGEDSQQECVQQ
jgi:DnaJ-class molecular chaperone